MRLIDADALMNVIDMKFKEHYGNTVYQFIHDFFRFVLRQIRKAPTIDAVPVVRCGECERRDNGFVSEKGTISCPYMEAFMPADGFCSYGERKDGEG